MATQWYQAIHTTKPRFRRGTIKKDYAGNQYIYLPGVASNVVGAWVSYNAVNYDSTPVLAATNIVGPLAVSMSANVSGTTNQLPTPTTVNWSWYLVFGNTLTAGALDNGPAPGAALYLCGTAATLDDSSTAGQFVSGAVCTVQSVTAGSIGAMGVFVNFPFAYNSAAKT